LVVTLVAAALVGGAAPVSAKGINAVRVIDGPGIDEPIAIRNAQSGYELAQAFGLYEIAYGRSGLSVIPRPPGDLGPLYEVEFRAALSGGLGNIRQRIFPFAGGGPVVHTPGGQQLEHLDPDHPDRPCSVCRRTADTWHRAAPEVLTSLRSLDLPAPRTTFAAARVAARDTDGWRTVFDADGRIRLRVPRDWTTGPAVMLPDQVDPVMPLAVGTTVVEPQPVDECGIVPQRALEAVGPTDAFVGIYVTSGLASWGATVPERPKTFAAPLPWGLGPMKCTINVTALQRSIAFEENGVKLTLVVATGAEISDQRRAELAAVLDSLRVSAR